MSVEFLDEFGNLYFQRNSGSLRVLSLRFAGGRTPVHQRSGETSNIESFVAEERPTS